MKISMKTIVLSLLLLCTACGSSVPEERYDLKGWVVNVRQPQSQVTIKHEEIPGFMGAMTMPFNVKDEWAFEALAPGRYVQATLVVQEDRSWLEDIVISESPPAGDPGTAEDPPGPEPGDEIPDYSLLNQDGETISLTQYRGKALLITFIYTRCPIPDFCPLMTANFSKIHQSVKKDPALAAGVHLLSISFDNEFDTPEVLRQYGAGYAGPNDPDPFLHWEFLTGSDKIVKEITGYFGLSYWPEGGQIIHSLRTALISPEGKLVHLYRDNEWKVEEVLDRLSHLIKHGA
jgi:protein SCO1/2